MKNISTSHKTLIIITEIYPYLGGEQFLYNEFIELSRDHHPLCDRDDLCHALFIQTH